MIRLRSRIGLAATLAGLLAAGPAAAYSHSNAYGGHSSGSAGEAGRHTNEYGGSTSHEYGEGTEHTNTYGGSTEHSYYGGTSHTNVYGGTTTGAYGAGAYHTTVTARRRTTRPTYYGGAYYHPPAAYYPYPYHAPYPTTSCGGCGWAVAGAAMAGAAVGAAAASSSAQASSTAAYQSGYAAGTATHRRGDEQRVRGGCRDRRRRRHDGGRAPLRHGRHGAALRRRPHDDQRNDVLRFERRLVPAVLRSQRSRLHRRAGALRAGTARTRGERHDGVPQPRSSERDGLF